VRLARRIAKVEAAAAVELNENSHEGVARWHARFVRADPRHRAVVEEIRRRAAVHTPGMCVPHCPPMHVGHCFLSMVHQLNLTGQENAWYDPARRVADWPEARRVMTEFMDLLASYQRETGDVFPGWGYGVERLVDERARRAWGPTRWETGAAGCAGESAPRPV